MKKLLLILFIFVGGQLYGVDIEYKIHIPCIKYIEQPYIPNPIDINERGGSFQFKVQTTSETTTEILNEVLQRAIFINSSYHTWLRIENVYLQACMTGREGTFNVVFSPNTTSDGRILKITSPMSNNEVIMYQPAVKIFSIIGRNPIHVMDDEKISVTLAGSVSGQTYYLCQSNEIIGIGYGTGQFLTISGVNSTFGTLTIENSNGVRMNGSISPISYYEIKLGYPENSVMLDKNGGELVMKFSKLSNPFDTTLLQELLDKCNNGLSASWDKHFVLKLTKNSADSCEITLTYDMNRQPTSIVSLSRFWVENKGSRSYIRFEQPGGGGIVAYDIESGNQPTPFVRVTGSQVGVTYRLCRNGDTASRTMKGTGRSIMFDDLEIGWTYTVKGEMDDGAITKDMNGSASLLGPLENIFTKHANLISTSTYYDFSQSYFDITYYDGLGAPFQIVHHRASTDGRNLITPILYDNMYRDNAKILLPFPVDDSTAKYKFMPEPTQNTYYSQLTTGDKDTSPYALNVYDKSGLDRIRYSYRPGDVYKQADKFTEYTYQTNDSIQDRILDFVYNYDDSSIKVGRRSSAKLFKNTVIDEDNNKSEQYTDVNGNLVLDRRYTDLHHPLDTYYVYDSHFSRLCWVIPPEASCDLVVGQRLGWDDELSNQYCYRYLYDGLGNVIERQLPGSAKELFVYDKSDHLVFWCDGNLLSRKQWMYYVYDNYGNLLRQNLLSYDISRTSLQELYSNQLDNRLPTLGGTTDIDIPYGLTRDNLVQALVCNVYGNRQYVGGTTGFVETDWDVPSDLAFIYNTACQATALIYPVGLKTYEKLAVLTGSDSGSHGYAERTYFYDYKSRPIQIVERNNHGGISRLYYRYDILGNLLSSQEILQPHAGAPRDTLSLVCSYDHRGRLTKEVWALNNSDPVTIDYHYNELGRLISKTTPDSVFNTSLRYNIQGWLTEQRNDKFDMKLRYYDPQQATTVKSYTGNITEWEWQHKEDAQSSTNTYAFTYDKLSRLTNSDQYVNNTLNNQFVEQGLQYDNNGNILALKRYNAGVLSDDYTYSYNGNQLAVLNQTMLYEYDANGNMTHDGCRGIDLEYNYLNLLAKVSSGGTTKANYTYLADGTKVGVVGDDGRGFDYMGSLVYKRDGTALELESAAFSGGRIIASSSTSGIIYEPNYFLTDHLGSVRVVVDSDGQVKERNDYYPYGKKHTNPDLMASVNRYGFSGKELQTTGDVNYLDFGARMYDSRIGHWFNPDLLLEKYFPISPYAYCAGNPISRVDPDGMDWYFGQQGYFLGVDELETDFIRIMDQSVWEFRSCLNLLAKLLYSYFQGAFLRYFAVHSGAYGQKIG